MEFKEIGASPSIQTTTVRAGTYAGRIFGLANAVRQYFEHMFVSGDVQTDHYFRGAFRWATLPNVETTILAAGDISFNIRSKITVDSTGTIKLYDEDGQITGTTTVTTGIWYVIELRHFSNSNLNSAIAGRVDGVEFAGSTTRGIGTGISRVRWGGNINAEGGTSGEWFIDDLAVNDDSGISQNSWPGLGRITHLRPNAAGDSNQLLVGSGAAASTTNYTHVNEVTPDDKAVTTNYLKYASTLLVPVDDYNVDNATTGGIDASDTIVLVGVGTRIMGTSNTAGDGRRWQYRIKGQSGGTVSQSAIVLTDSVNTRTHINTLTFHNYQHHAYTNPQTSAAWIVSEIDSMQIGAEGVAPANAGEKQISTIWALTEYIPYVAPPSGTNTSNFFQFI